MLKIDNALLEEVGLSSLPDDEKERLLVHLRESLEMRVGTKLASAMSDEQLNEFESLAQAGDDMAVFNWLRENFPHYREVVEDELDLLKKELATDSEQILKVADS